MLTPLLVTGLLFGRIIFVPQFLNYCNKDKNSRITREEFFQCFDEFFDYVDQNKDGVVTKKEYDDQYQRSLKAYKEKMREQFRKMDRDKDGFLKDKELPEALKSADSNKDGRLSLEEYLKYQTRDFRIIHLGLDFKAADRNRDGKVTREEQRRAVEFLFRWLDASGDGVITPLDAKLQAQRRKKSEKRGESNARGSNNGGSGHGN